MIFFYNFARPSPETITYCYATGILQNQPNVRAMQLIGELFMFFVKIKLGLFQQDLAHRFNLHKSTVSRKLTTWADYLYFLLGNQMIWPSRADVNAKMPQEFKRFYPTTHVILVGVKRRLQTADYRPRVECRVGLRVMNNSCGYTSRLKSKSHGCPDRDWKCRKARSRTMMLW